MTPYTSPLRIALLSVDFPPANTHGVARSTHALARGLVELGHEVHVVTSGRCTKPENREGYAVHEVDGSERRRYRSFAARGYPNLAAWLDFSHAAWERVKQLNEDRPLDVVDSPLWNLDGLVTTVTRRLPVVVRVVTAMKQIADVHGQQSPETEVLGELEGRMLRLADGVISNSRASDRTMAEVYGIHPRDIVHGMVPYGMIPASDAEVPKPAGGSDIAILFVGRLEKRKGILDLFAAIPRVLETCANAKFLIVGADNSREDGSLEENGLSYPELFRREHSGLVKRVEFHGFVDENRLRELYRSCDLLVAPSLYESFGLIFLEAMNYAKPVIGCASGGPLDIIEDEATGLLVPPGNPEALAAAIRRLVDDRELRARCGLAGRERLLEHYSHTAMANGFVEVYRRAIRAHQAQASATHGLAQGEEA